MQRKYVQFSWCKTIFSVLSMGHVCSLQTGGIMWWFISLLSERPYIPVWSEHVWSFRQKRKELPHYPTGLEWTCVVFQTEKKRTTTLSHRSGVNMCGLSDRKEKNYHIIPPVWSEHVWSFRQKRTELPFTPDRWDNVVVLFFSVWKTTHVHSRPVG